MEAAGAATDTRKYRVTYIKKTGATIDLRSEPYRPRPMEKERGSSGLPALPLTPPEVEEICQALESADREAGAPLRTLLEERVAPGVDPAAKVKAELLAAVAKGKIKPAAVSREEAVRILGTMLGGYNVEPLVEALADKAVAAATAEALKKIVLVYGHFDTILKLSAANPFAKSVLGSWAAGEWFLTRPAFPSRLGVTVYKVDGEITAFLISSILSRIRKLSKAMSENPWESFNEDDENGPGETPDEDIWTSETVPPDPWALNVNLMKGTPVPD